MSGFMKKIYGDGSSGLNTYHRDIGNCKIYTPSDSDQIVGFAPPAGNTAQTWFFCLKEKTNDSFGAIFTNIGAGNVIDKSAYHVLYINGKFYFRMYCGNNTNKHEVVTDFVYNQTKRNIITVRKLVGWGAANIQIFFNGNLVQTTNQTYINGSSNYAMDSPQNYHINKYINTGGNSGGKIAHFSAVNYAQSDEEIARDAALGYQQASSGLFLLNVDFDKTTGDDLTDTSPAGYTITTTGTKNFAPFQ